MAGFELSEDDLFERYGGLIWSAVSAFGEDPSYLGDMTEAANSIAYKRQMWNARSEAVKQADHPDDVRALTVSIMESRGVVSPTARKRRAAA